MNATFSWIGIPGFKLVMVKELEKLKKQFSMFTIVISVLSFKSREIIIKNKIFEVVFSFCVQFESSVSFLWTFYVKQFT